MIILAVAVVPVDSDNMITDLTVGQILALAGTITAIVVLIRAINPIMKRLNEFMDDWFGEKARPGHKAKPGAMERLDEQDEVLASLRKTVSPLVDETAAGNHKEVLQRLDDIKETTIHTSGHVIRLERLLHRHIRESKTWVMAVDKAAAERDFKMPPWPDLPDVDEDERNPHHD